jgi:hypothetical protein
MQGQVGALFAEAGGQLAVRLCLLGVIAPRDDAAARAVHDIPQKKTRRARVTMMRKTAFSRAAFF